MESANHEFTWMSGHAQLASSSCSHQNKSPSSSTKSDDHQQVLDNRPTPLPRAAVVQDQSTGSKKLSPPPKRPIPLPRIFRRRSTSTSSSSTSSDSAHNIYDQVPRDEPASSTTFYVSSATYGHNQVTEEPPATNCGHHVIEEPAAVDRSVIIEFDPIMQSATSNPDDHQSAAAELQSLESRVRCYSLTDQTETQECDIYLPNEVEGPEADQIEVSNLALQRLSPEATSSRPMPKPRQKIPENFTQSPELPPKTSKSIKFGLSTVPPPPSTSVTELISAPGGDAASDSDQEEVINVSGSSKISPIHIDNPCYMFVMPVNNSAGNFEQETHEETTSSSDASSLPHEYDDPIDEVVLSSMYPVRSMATDCELVVDDYATPPNAIIVSSELQCPPAPKASRYVPVQSDSATKSSPIQMFAFDAKAVLTSLPAANKNNRFPSPSSYIPIYQNLMEIYGSREGVYAQIRKTAVGANQTQTSTSTSAPPLPPRGQQRTPATPTTTTTTVEDCTVDHQAASRATVARTLSRRSEQLTEVIRNIPHRGHLFRIGRNRKEMMQKWVVLERGHLQLYADDKSANPQDIYHQSDMVSVARGQDVKFNHRDMSTFELVTNNSGAIGKDRPHAFGAKYEHERDAWIQHVVQSIAPSVSMTTDSGDIEKAGYVQVRKAVSGVWHEYWVILSGKTLSLWLTADSSLLELDLRKLIFMQEYESDPQTSMAVTDEQPLFVVHYPELTLYVMSKVIFDTADWFRRLKNASLETGRGLEEQQLTHDDVPIVLDKCIKFVSTYGISTKGIYRESGTNSKIAKLVDYFHKDARKVHISPDEFTEHDVANVLKRYLRTLPEALLTKRLYKHWVAAHALPKTDANAEYLQLLNELPRINYMTLKKLIAHLKSVTEQDHLNLMGTSNVASLFGPTLLSTERDVIMANNGAEVEVVFDLITNYATLFGVSDEEIEKEERIQKALQDLRAAKRAQKPAGDILVGIYIYSRQWGKCLNVKLSPTMSALDLCQYAIQQMRMRDRVENLVVYEVTCDAELERPLHHSEIVLAVTLRWACWSDVDARDSYLLLKKSEIFHSIVPLARQPLSMFGELRFADLRSKSFKKFMFEFKNARLAYYKDATISQPLGSWNIEDITWYIGSDSRRQKPTGWALTFIEQKAVIKRGTKEMPYFGRTICFLSEEEFYRWMAAMLIGQYPNGILPKVDPIDLLV